MVCTISGVSVLPTMPRISYALNISCGRVMFVGVRKRLIITFSIVHSLVRMGPTLCRPATLYAGVNRGFSDSYEVFRDCTKKLNKRVGNHLISPGKAPVGKPT